jgi:hypothetical protein
MQRLSCNWQMKAIIMAAIVFKLSEGFTVLTPVPVRISTTFMMSTNSSDMDCGCGKTIYSGKPSDDARNVDPRSVIGSLPIFSVHGESTSVNDQLGMMYQGTSIVVLLRSLG